jgi:hypothetical protein
VPDALSPPHPSRLYTIYINYMDINNHNKMPALSSFQAVLRIGFY